MGFPIYGIYQMGAGENNQILKSLWPGPRSRLLRSRICPALDRFCRARRASRSSAEIRVEPVDPWVGLRLQMPNAGSPLKSRGPRWEACSAGHKPSCKQVKRCVHIYIYIHTHRHIIPKRILILDRICEFPRWEYDGSTLIGPNAYTTA